HQGLLALRDWLHPGDADLDGAVTAADYVIWRKHAGSAGDWRDGDFSGDGMVNNTDYTIWRSKFGLPAPGSGAGLTGAGVPEPQSCALLMLGIVIAASRRGNNLLRRR